MAPRKAKPAPTPAPEEAPETESAVTAPDAPEVAEEAPHEITVAFPLEPRTVAPEDAPLLLRVDY